MIPGIIAQASPGASAPPSYGFAGYAIYWSTDVANAISFNFSTATSLIGGFAAHPQAGDLLIMNACRYFGASGAAAAWATNPGFSTIYQLYANDSNDAGVLTAYMNDWDGTSKVGAIDGWESGVAIGIISVWRGYEYNGNSASTTAVNGPAPNPPSVTPTVAGSLILLLANYASDSVVDLAHPNDALLYSVQRSGSLAKGTSAAALKSNWTSGAYDAAAFTGGTGNSADSAVSAAVVLEPTF